MSHSILYSTIFSHSPASLPFSLVIFGSPAPTGKIYLIRGCRYHNTIHAQNPNRGTLAIDRTHMKRLTDRHLIEINAGMRQNGDPMCDPESDSTAGALRKELIGVRCGTCRDCCCGTISERKRSKARQIENLELGKRLRHDDGYSSPQAVGLSPPNSRCGLSPIPMI